MKLFVSALVGALVFAALIMTFSRLRITDPYFNSSWEAFWDHAAMMLICLVIMEWLAAPARRWLPKLHVPVWAANISVPLALTLPIVCMAGSIGLQSEGRILKSDIAYAIAVSAPVPVFYAVLVTLRRWSAALAPHWDRAWLRGWGRGE